MGLLFTAAERVLNAMAQWEARKGNFGSGYRAQKWSVWYLRLMQVRHGKHVTMGLDIYIRNRGNLTLGERCGIGSFARIWNYAPITIGEDFMSAGGLTLNSATHDPVTLEPRASPFPSAIASGAA